MLQGDIREHCERSDRSAILVFVLKIWVVAMMLLDFGFEVITQTRGTVQGDRRIAVRHRSSSRSTLGFHGRLPRERLPIPTRYFYLR